VRQFLALPAPPNGYGAESTASSAGSADSIIDNGHSISGRWLDNPWMQIL
jgi:hypothetical protein